MDIINNPKISISNPDLTETERQAVPFSTVMTEEQASSVYRASHAEPGKSK